MGAVPDIDTTSQRQDRLLTTLERLLELPVTEVNTTLTHAAQLLAEVLATDQVDIFFHDPTNDTLVPLGLGGTAKSRQKKVLGMDGPLPFGERIVEVFLTGTSYLTGHPYQDSNELVSNNGGPGIKSEIAAVFRVRGQHRGVLRATSATPEFFSRQDLHFL